VLGCSANIKDCMKQKSVEEIYKGIEKAGIRFLKWGAVIDGEFLQHPDEMAAAAPPKVSLIGLTNKEAALFTIKKVAPFMHKFGVDPSDYPKWNRDRLIAELK
ncbi:hypothetical protein ANCDUO_21288, partial [Ancylostoma duodenale]